MKSKNEMKKVILHFALKYKGNWEKVYDAIKAKEDVTIEQVTSLKDKYNDNLMTIIDEDYPNNFKSIYMPPLTIFFLGNKELMHNDDNIVSLWGETTYEQVIEAKLDKSKVYAINYSAEKQSDVERLLSEDYKLILVTNNYKTSEIGFIANYDNVVLMTEIPFDIKKADIDMEQTTERLILGISKVSLMLGKKSLNTFEYLEPLFKFEKRPIAVTNLSDFNENEIQRFDIKLYNNYAN